MGSSSAFDFHNVLSSLAEELGAQEVHLAALGLQIRQKLPGFAPANYGYTTFTDLLRSCTEIGDLRFGEKPEDRWFVFKTVARPAEASLNQHEIVKSVWNACVDIDESHRVWLDLADCRQLEMDADKVGNEAERYLELPRFDRARQIALLEAFSERTDHSREALLAIVRTWEAEKSPYARLLHELQVLGHRQAWFAYLRHTVETALRAWAIEHGIPPAVLFAAPKQHKAVARVAHRSALDRSPTFEMDEHHLRAFLKAAIDEMTLAELGQWPVPARLLLTKPRR